MAADVSQDMLLNPVKLLRRSFYFIYQLLPLVFPSYLTPSVYTVIPGPTIRSNSVHAV